MCRIVIATVIPVLLAATLPASAQGQSFAFSIGGGHHHHGHGHWHGCGPCYGPPWWGPSLGVLYAPPVVRERVIYVEPQRTTVIVPSSTVTATPVPANSWSAGTASASQITIRNASGSQLPVAFLVDGQDVELADGQSRTFTGQIRHSIKYDRGGRYGSTEQDVTAGNYDFRVTASGWDLVRQPDAPVVSRTAVRANSLPQR